MILGKVFEISRVAFDYKTKYPYMNKVDKVKWIQRKIEMLGPTYIKMGQFLSNRGDMIEDQDFKMALTKLHDDVEPLPWSHIESLVTLPDEFDDIQRVPIAAASIGQVHRGKLKGGQEIVIKIRRPNILKEVDNDIGTIKGFLSLLLLINPASRQQQIRDAIVMVDDVKRSMMREADMYSEVKNMQEFSGMKLPNTYLPKVYGELCNEHTIVMEYVPSVKFNDSFPFTDTKNRKKLAFDIMDIFIRQFLYYGTIHGDPHPGNIALTPDLSSFVMYDFGTIVTLDKNTRNYFKLLVFELMNDNLDNVMAILENLSDLVKINNTSETKMYIASYMKYIKTIDINEFKKAVSKSSTENIPILFSSKFFEIIRIFGTIEGICLELDPDFSYEEVFANYSDVLFNDSDFLMLKSVQDTCKMIDMF